MAPGAGLLLAHPNALEGAARPLDGSAKSAFTRFKVSYQAKFMGAKLTATSRLRELREDFYKYEFNTTSSLGKVTERSRFALVDGAGILPQGYRFKVSAMGASKNIKLAFDWRAGRVTDRAAKLHWTIDLPRGALDPLGMQLQLGEDVLNGRTHMTYQVVRDGRLKDYHYVVEDPEITDTLIGPLRTLRVRRDQELIFAGGTVGGVPTSPMNAAR